MSLEKIIGLLVLRDNIADEVDLASVEVADLTDSRLPELAPAGREPGAAQPQRDLIGGVDAIAAGIEAVILKNHRKVLIGLTGIENGDAVLGLQGNVGVFEQGLQQGCAAVAAIADEIETALETECRQGAVSGARVGEITLDLIVTVVKPGLRF
jgi:hypothetical protein